MSDAASPAETIRLAQQDDLAAIAEITNHYIRTTTIHFGYEEVSVAEFEAMFAQDRQRYPWLCAVAGSPDQPEVLGYAKAGTWRARAAYQWTPEVGIYIDKDARGQGIGTRLYQRLLDTLRLQGYHSAIAGATMPNDASMRLHEALGFVQIGRFAEVGRKFDTWHDVCFWQRTLGNQGGQPICSPAEAFAQTGESI